MAHRRQHRCPACKTPIRVGDHSITIDRERIKEEAMQELLEAATDIRDIELPKLKRLREALAALDEISRLEK